MSAITQAWLAPSQALQLSQIPDFVLSTGLPLREEKRYGFRCGNLNFLIATQTHSELAYSRQIASLPGAPDYLLGLYNQRGNLIPVFHLALALGLSSPSGAPPYLLILEQREQALAIAIEHQPEHVRQLSILNGQHAIPEILLKHVSQVCLSDKQAWLEFDHKSFFKSLAQN